MALPQLWVHDHSERGRDERITDEWRYVCELETGMPGSRQGRWNCPEQRGQKMTARARDLAACSIKKPVVEQLDRSESEPSETSSHPCLLPPRVLCTQSLHPTSPLSAISVPTPLPYVCATLDDAFLFLSDIAATHQHVLFSRGLCAASIH
jgi:hypothetical protein